MITELGHLTGLQTAGTNFAFNSSMHSRLQKKHTE